MFLKKIFFALKKLKKPPSKVAYLSRILVVSEIFHNTAQMAEFMFQDMAYRATVYRTGIVYKTTNPINQFELDLIWS